MDYKPKIVSKRIHLGIRWKENNEVFYPKEVYEEVN